MSGDFPPTPEFPVGPLGSIERAYADGYAAAQAKIESDAKVIAALTDAIWEYGEHRKSCRIDSGKECDCGFFDVIKTLKSTNEQTAGTYKAANGEDLPDGAAGTTIVNDGRPT